MRQSGPAQKQPYQNKPPPNAKRQGTAWKQYQVFCRGLSHGQGYCISETLTQRPSFAEVAIASRIVSTECP